MAARVQQEPADTHVQHGRVQSCFRFTKVPGKVRARSAPPKASIPRSREALSLRDEGSQEEGGRDRQSPKSVAGRP